MRLCHREKDFVRLLASTRNSFTDVELRGPEYGSVVRAHRAHLAHFSPFLRNLFRDPDRRSEPLITVLLDPDIHFPSVVSLVRLLYAGSLTESLDSESYTRLEETGRMLGFRIPALSVPESLPGVKNFRCIGCQGVFTNLSQLETHSMSCRPSISDHFIPRRKKNAITAEGMPLNASFACPLCGNKYSNMSTVRFHLASHCRKQIMDRVADMIRDDRGTCSLCRASYKPRTSSILWHFGVVHHYVKDYLDSDVFERYFASAGSRTKEIIKTETLEDDSLRDDNSLPIVENVRKRTYIPSNVSEKLECPMCLGNFVDIHSLRKHFVRHFRDQIKEKISQMSDDPENCVICAAHIPKCSLNHYGVSHHFVRDYLDPSIYDKFFSSHPNYKRQRIQIPEENPLAIMDDSDFEVRREIVPEDEEEEQQQIQQNQLQPHKTSTPDGSRISRHQDKLALLLAEEGQALDIKKRGCYCFPCPICHKGEYVVCELRLHMASHFRKEIMEKIASLTSDRTKCVMCSALVPRSLLRHYGVVHHFVKDFMEPSMYHKYFSTHPNFLNPLMASNDDEEYVEDEDEGEEEEEIIEEEEFYDSRMMDTEENSELFEAEESLPAFTWSKDTSQNPLYPEVLINTEMDPN